MDYQEVDGKMILKLRCRVGGCGLEPSDAGKEPVAGSYKHSNKPPGSIKENQFLY
jgi:hypothetical protein